MRLICVLAQRRLSLLMARGEALPATGWLSRHLSACPDCREARQSFGEIAAALSVSDPIRVPDNLATRAMERIAAQIQTGAKVRSLRRDVVAVPAAAVLLCTLSLMGWLVFGRPSNHGVANVPPVQVRSVTGAEDVSQSSPAREASGARSRSRPNEQTSEPAPAPRLSSSRQPQEQLRLLLERARRKVAKSGFRAERERANSAGTAATPTTQGDPVFHETVLQVAVYYESAQDYRHAALAYGLAAKEAWSPAIALAAGRTAEAVGDYTTAVAHYQRVLQTGTGANSNAVDTPH